MSRSLDFAVHLKMHADKFNSGVNKAESEMNKLSRAVKGTGGDFAGFNEDAKKAEKELLGFANANEIGTRQARKLEKQINKAGETANRSSGNYDKLGKSLMGFAAAYVSINTVTTGIRELVDTSKELDSLNQKLEYATGSAEEAGKTWEYLKDMANELGLEQVDLANGYAQLASATKDLGLSSEQTKTAFEGVANASAAMSLTADEANGVFLALSQIAGKGKVSMEELRGQLGERLTPAMSIAAKAMGVTTAELEKMVESGINAKEFLPKFGTALTEAFGEKAKNNINTTTGAINQLKNKVTDVKEQLLEGFAGEGITNGINLLSQGIEQISEAIDNIDPATIDATNQIFVQSAEAVKQLAVFIVDTYNNVSDLINAFAGLDGTEEQIGLLTRALQGMGIIIGGVSDVFKGLKAVAELTVAGITTALANVYERMSQLELLPDRIQSRYRELSESLRVVGKDAFKDFQESANSFESSFVKALDSTLATAENTASQIKASYADTTAEVINKFGDVATASKSTSEEIYKSFSESLKVIKTREGLDELLYGMLELQNQGKISGEQMAEAMGKATERLKKLETQTEKDIQLINKLAEESIKANDGMISKEVEHEASLRNLRTWVDELGNVYVAMANDATQSAQDIKTEMTDTAQSLGIDFELASNKISKAMQKSVDDVTRLATNFNQLQDEGYNASNLLAQALQNMADKAKNRADYEKLISLWRQFGAEGRLSTKQVEAGLDAINAKMQKSPELIDETKKAFQELGIISKAEADKQAQAQMEAFERVKASNQASGEQLQKALENMSGAIEATGDSAIKTWYESQKSAQGVNETVEATTQSYQRQAVAIEEVKQADNEATASQISNASNMLDVLRNVENAIKSRINDLQQYGATAEQTEKALNNIMQSQFFDGQRWADIDSYGRAMETLNAGIERQVTNFENARNKAVEHTQALSGANVTTKDLANAQHALRQATDANVQGLIRMDSQTLNSLQSAIDSARSKMKDLSDTAQDTADAIELALAKERGEDAKARELEQSKKLLELQEKLAEAKARGNNEEVAGYERAIRAQRELNKEQDKKAKERKQAEQAKETKRQLSNNNIDNRTTQPQQQSQRINQSINIPDISINIDTSIVAQELSDAMQASAQSVFDKNIREMANAIKRTAN